jgi:hypothetical protein
VCITGSRNRTKVSEPGKSFYPFNMDAPIAFGDINNTQKSVLDMPYQDVKRYSLKRFLKT